jgi:hypothetical protein
MNLEWDSDDETSHYRMNTTDLALICLVIGMLCGLILVTKCKSENLF